MFKIIGADQQEYGPVTESVIRQWIAERRANGQTRVQAAGDTTWKPLADFPQFAAALAAKAATIALPPSPAPPAPPPSATNADALCAAALARCSTVDIGHCIGRSWDLMLKHFWLCVGATALIWLVNGAVAGIPLVGGVASMVLFGPLHGSLSVLFLKLVRGERAELGDAFCGFNTAFVPLMLCGLFTNLLTGLGFLACLLPGIYLLVAWKFALLLVLDQRLDFWPAMEVSRKVITERWWEFCGLVIVLFLLTLVGVLGCFVGVFLTMTIATGALVYAYEDFFGPRPAPTA